MKIDVKLLLLFTCIPVILFLLHRSCNREIATTVEATTTIRVDTLKVRDTVYFPKPYRVIELRIDTLYIDTPAVIRDYFTDKYYLLSYQDTLLQASAEVKISQNTVEMAKFDYEVYRPTIHTTTVITEKKMQCFSFSLGGGISYNITGKRAGIELLSGIGIQRHSIQIGYDFINQTPRMGWQYQVFRK